MPPSAGAWLVYSVSILVTSVAGAWVQRKHAMAGPPLTLLAVMAAVWICLLSAGFRRPFTVGEVVTAIAMMFLPALAACLVLLATRRWWLAFRVPAACLVGLLVAFITPSAVLSLACGSIAAC